MEETPPVVTETAQEPEKSIDKSEDVPVLQADIDPAEVAPEEKSVTPNMTEESHVEVTPEPIEQPPVMVEAKEIEDALMLGLDRGLADIVGDEIEVVPVLKRLLASPVEKPDDFLFQEADDNEEGIVISLASGVAVDATPIALLLPSSPTRVPTPPPVEVIVPEPSAIEPIVVQVSLPQTPSTIDRDSLIMSIKLALDAKDRFKFKNTFLQNKLSEYFKRKRTDDSQDGEKSVSDQEQRYANCMVTIASLQADYESLNNTNQKIVNEYKQKLSERTLESMEKSNEFIKFKRQVAMAAENSRTGKAIPAKTISQMEALEQKKEADVKVVRLENIKLRNKLKRHEQMLRQKEELADGLHLIDFEQLKIENHTYNEKIEERNEELLKLRKKITNIVQVLTHVKEKLQFVQTENSNLKKELRTLDVEVSKRRDSLPLAKQQRDAIKDSNQTIRRRNGLLGNTPLLRDFEQKMDETSVLRNKIDELRTKHANLSAEALTIRRQIQKQFIA